MKPLRVLISILLSGALVAVDLMVAPTARACACGGFVATGGEQVAADAEYAALSWDGTTEQVILSMDTKTVSKDAALLIPTPAPAKAALDEPDVFTQLKKATAPTVRIKRQWWPEWGFGDGNAAGAPSSSGSHVDVLRTSRLGPLEVSVLAADNADKLTAWLNAHHYVMRSSMAKALRPYVKQGWYYTAIRLVADEANLSGALQPLALRFSSAEFVYPMRLSAAAPESQFVRTYVFADHQVKRTDETRTSTPGPSLYFAGRLPPDAVTAESLVSIRQQHPYLTVIDQYFSNPEQQIVSDFTFARADQDHPYRQIDERTRMVSILGAPAGPMLIFFGVVVAAVVGVVVLLLRRHRRSV